MKGVLCVCADLWRTIILRALIDDQRKPIIIKFLGNAKMSTIIRH